MYKTNFDLPTMKKYEDIILNNIPIIDVRAPIEFEKGSIPNSINLPIMTDSEREKVGTCYKQEGRDAAMKLGYDLVSGDTKKSRIKAWNDFISKYPNALVMCFRGGLRSRIAQSWIHESGMHQPLRIEGGYKDFRNFLIESTLPENIPMRPIVLGGSTGVGKTILLRKLKNSIDLEHLANHRGSSFGGHISPQPTQINFENHLAYEVIKQKSNGYKTLLLELESRNIGKLIIPKPFLGFMNTADIVSVVLPLSDRVEITWQEYVIDSLSEYTTSFKETGESMWQDNIRENIKKLRRKLGGDRLQEVLELFDEACHKENLDDHRNWIEYLLKNYYDPMYDYQKSKWEQEVIFEGNPKEVEGFLESIR